METASNIPGLEKLKEKLRTRDGRINISRGFWERAGRLVIGTDDAQERALLLAEYAALNLLLRGYATTAGSQRGAIPSPLELVDGRFFFLESESDFEAFCSRGEGLQNGDLVEKINEWRLFLEEKRVLESELEEQESLLTPEQQEIVINSLRSLYVALIDELRPDGDGLSDEQLIATLLALGVRPSEIRTSVDQVVSTVDDILNALGIDRDRLTEDEITFFEGMISVLQARVPGSVLVDANGLHADTVVGQILYVLTPYVEQQRILGFQIEETLYEAEVEEGPDFNYEEYNRRGQIDLVNYIKDGNRVTDSGVIEAIAERFDEEIDIYEVSKGVGGIMNNGLYIVTDRDGRSILCVIKRIPAQYRRVGQDEANHMAMFRRDSHDTIVPRVFFGLEYSPASEFWIAMEHVPLEEGIYIDDPGIRAEAITKALRSIENIHTQGGYMIDFQGQNFGFNQEHNALRCIDWGLTKPSQDKNVGTRDDPPSLRISRDYYRFISLIALRCFGFAPMTAESHRVHRVRDALETEALEPRVGALLLFLHEFYEIQRRGIEESLEGDMNKLFQAIFSGVTVEEQSFQQLKGGLGIEGDDTLEGLFELMLVLLKSSGTSRATKRIILELYDDLINRQREKEEEARDRITNKQVLLSIANVSVDESLLGAANGAGVAGWLSGIASLTFLAKTSCDSYSTEPAVALRQSLRDAFNFSFSTPLPGVDITMPRWLSQIRGFGLQARLEERRAAKYSVYYRLDSLGETEIKDLIQKMELGDKRSRIILRVFFDEIWQVVEKKLRSLNMIDKVRVVGEIEERYTDLGLEISMGDQDMINNFMYGLGFRGHDDPQLKLAFAFLGQVFYGAYIRVSQEQQYERQSITA